ncbi:MAG TPA: purine-nucleoside phosphorylase [Candidatus Limnocylindria bacterium]|nr:purine-nucleoside phosphorylase [Candidatus Limnocylindria bacterium]
MKAIRKAADAVEQAVGTADTAVILGTGLGGFETLLTEALDVPYEDVPGFPVSTVQGHAGKFVSGSIGGRRVLVMAGRVHSYEGYGMDKVTLPVRVMCLLGVRHLIVTNAAGAVNESFRPGDLVLLDDFINLSGRNPLRGKNLDQFGPRFPDMTYAYDPALKDVALQAAGRLGVDLKRGVYAWFNGPSFETPAEIRMARVLGADLVGMSTVPETIVARHCGMRVLGISSVTNMAAGVVEGPIDHEGVLAVGEGIKDTFRGLVSEIIRDLPDAETPAM